MQPLDLILERFMQLSAVPRGTFQEERIREWLQGWAASRGLLYRTDEPGNLVIYVPASPGYETRPAVILQGHMDMVQQKTAESTHDFTRDPIRVMRSGDWLRADGTTLGADNGIAIALMMALAEDSHLPHPPLEYLLTVEEEHGVRGALNVDPALLTGRTLLNLDSEEDGVFTNGCAGGWTLYITLPVEWAPIEAGWQFFRLRVDGLRGGHSGGDIHKRRGNANKLIGRALEYAGREVPFRLASLKGGTVRNAIPREAEATLAIRRGQDVLFRQKLDEFQGMATTEFGATDPGLNITLDEIQGSASLVTALDSQRMIKLLNALPNGVSEMSPLMEELTETSNNIGIMELKEEGFYIVSNHRSLKASKLEEIMVRVDSVAQLAGARTERNNRTTPWEPQPNSPLLEKSREVYFKEFGSQPKVEMTHGGLECGILSARVGGLDSLSLGPTILNPHSPDESLNIPSVVRVWTFLTALLRSL